MWKTGDIKTKTLFSNLFESNKFVLKREVNSVGSTRNSHLPGGKSLTIATPLFKVASFCKYKFVPSLLIAITALIFAGKGFVAPS
jgi:hypothetical protein